MNVPFFYENFEKPEGLVLGAENIHYLLNVLRMRSGEPITIVNGRGTSVAAVLQVSGKRTAEIDIRQVSQDDPVSVGLHIAIAFTKNTSRIEWFLEKATEMGVQTISPLITMRSEKTFFRKERFEKILISAMLQSQQTFLPELTEPLSLAEIVRSSTGQKFIAWCGNDTPKATLLSKLAGGKQTLILIGPEGDFTADEVHLCREHAFEAISLGKNRLRTETAGVFVCALFNAIQ